MDCQAEAAISMSLKQHQERTHSFGILWLEAEGKQVRLLFIFIRRLRIWGV